MKSYSFQNDFLTFNHLTSVFVLDTSQSKVTFSFSATLISMMGLEIMAGGSVQSIHVSQTGAALRFLKGQSDDPECSPYPGQLACQKHVLHPLERHKFQHPPF